ncbi:cell wall hydrolase [Evansella halocellulosilytica]|uniref:cell wall hydrolase n=1 Tax=Evansella halocellulosilytica TaxID=2011013 RepID=UPI000BB7762B|nr:cell wall hydrolase [Evansella halocellulosilytica]
MKKIISVSFFTAVILFMSTSVYANSQTHIVQKDETLWSISQLYGLTVDQLKNANGLENNMIYPEQALTIPGEGNDQHTVRSDDTLWKISQAYGMSVDQLKTMNGIESNVIYPGQVLSVSTQHANETMNQYSQEELDLLARLVHAEAEGEPYEGKVAVASVVLNRVDHSDFPSTISNVINETYENGTIFAFEPVQNGHIERAADEEAVRAAEEAINGHDPTNGAIYFWNPETATSTWVNSRTVTMSIGNHVFAN